MLDTKRPAKAAIDAMAKQKVIIGRIWPVWPTYTRITVGTAPEMEQFQAAWQKVMTGAVTASVGAGFSWENYLANGIGLGWSCAPRGACRAALGWTDECVRPYVTLSL